VICSAVFHFDDWLLSVIFVAVRQSILRAFFANTLRGSAVRYCDAGV